MLATSKHAPFGDLRIYRAGGAAVLHGAPLYNLRFAWNLRFTYPPFAALAFVALALLPWQVAPALVTGASVVALPLTLWLALRLPGPHPTSARTSLGPGTLRVALLAAAAAIWLEPVRTNLTYGQVNLLIAALILYDLTRDEADRLKGAAIGLAAGLKLTPAIFILYLAATRRSRAAAIAAATFGLTVAAGFAAAPADSTGFWAGAFANPQRVGRIENAANQSLRGALARVSHTLNVDPLWLVAAVAVAVAGLVLAAAYARRGNEAAGFSLCAITGLLISPISWSHHWVLAVPALALLAVGAWRDRPRRRAALLACAAAAALIGWSRIIWRVPVGQGRHAELHLNALQLVFADAYVLAGLAALAAGAWMLMRTNHAPPAGQDSPARSSSITGANVSM